jgi:hypothetical protein
MTGPQFSTALTTLGLDNHQAAAWLGVSVRAVQRYRVTGAPEYIARSLERGVVIKNLAMWFRVLEQIHGKVKGGALEAVIDAENSLALDWRE